MAATATILALRVARPEELDTARDIDDDTSTLFSDAGLTFDMPKDHPFVLERRSAERRSCGF